MELQAVSPMPTRELEQGRRFEREFAAEMGLEQVHGSGSTWHSKLDVKGFRARWSLKWTRRKTYSISGKLLEEVQAATGAPGGTGEIGLHGFSLAGRWYVLMEASTFKAISAGELVLSRETKAEARRREAAVPELLRRSE